MHTKSFELLETLLWEPGEGFFLLDRHLRRLGRTADHFGYAFARDAVLAQLRAAVKEQDEPQRVRLRLAPGGHARVEACPVGGLPAVIRVAPATEAVNRDNEFLDHKTTCRRVYDAARQSRPFADDVVLFDRVGRVTETTIANIVLDRDGQHVTPVGPGLLPGVYREHLLEEAQLVEDDISLGELRSASRFWLINSVRRWMPAEWVDAAGKA